MQRFVKQLFAAFLLVHTTVSYAEEPAAKPLTPAELSKKTTGGFDFIETDCIALTTSPDGKVTLEIDKKPSLAHLIDVATGKPIGNAISTTRGHFYCWSFSNDGKYIALGTKDYQKGEGFERPTDIGTIQVCDATTGRLIYEFRPRIGTVHRIGFGKDDSKTIKYLASEYSIDGP